MVASQFNSRLGFINPGLTLYMYDSVCVYVYNHVGSYTHINDIIYSILYIGDGEREREYVCVCIYKCAQLFLFRYVCLGYMRKILENLCSNIFSFPISI